MTHVIIEEAGQIAQHNGNRHTVRMAVRSATLKTFQVQGIDRYLTDLTNRHKPVVTEGSLGSGSKQIRALRSVRHPIAPSGAARG